MKNIILRYKVLIAFLCGFLVCLVLGSALFHADTKVAANDHSDVLQQAIIRRIDQQNDVYFNLGDQFEALANSQGDEVELLEETKVFVSGVNIFVQMDYVPYYIELLYPEQETFLETWDDLTKATTAMDLEQVSQLSTDELSHLSQLCYALSDCCYRGHEDSFAYYISIQDTDSNEFHASVATAQALIDAWCAILDA
ncbi:hypothetical protein RFF05_18150 [Bengtsoniella intestinalis]|uniref:hypothetical protein n=1 Tax=Bengtsoniella intestinalis TaxID=3073143 RepID=UPI00391F89BC